MHILLDRKRLRHSSKPGAPIIKAQKYRPTETESIGALAFYSVSLCYQVLVSFFQP